MKKVTKLVAGVVLAASVAATAGALTGCGPSTETYTGSEVTNYRGTNISIGVDVTVTDGEITAITIADSSVVATGDKWATPFNDGKEALVNSLIGKTVDEVKALTTTYNSKENSLETVATGATVSSNVFVKAVQNALNNTQVVTGEYSYENSWTPGNYYGIKVMVEVKDGKIVEVSTMAIPDNWTNVTASWDTDGSKAAGVAEYLKKYEGKTVDEVMAIKVSKNEAGQPNTDEAGQASQGDLIYSGATQTSGRIILAVQDALADIK